MGFDSHLAIPVVAWIQRLTALIAAHLTPGFFQTLLVRAVAGRTE